MKSPEGDVCLLRGFPYPSVAAGSSECQAGCHRDRRVCFGGVVCQRWKIWLNQQKSRLKASVKLNKDLGRRCNVYADFHDLAGHPKAPFLTTEDAYHNRALTLGMTYKF